MNKSESQSDPANSCSEQSQTPCVRYDVQTIAGWPTDTISIDYYLTRENETSSNDSTKLTSICHPHTVLLFVPGNPGCVGWYVKLLLAIVERLGVGYAARGVSYAGHGVGEHIVETHDTIEEQQEEDHPPRDNKRRSSARNTEISWSVEGQVQHKVQWLDGVLARLTNPSPKLIFLTHSIGAHLVQRLCILRPDYLRRTELLVHLMPFIRFDPPRLSQKLPLTVAAGNPTSSVAILKTASYISSLIPNRILDKWFQNVVKDEEGRELALNLVRQPSMAKNFLELGLEEIRIVPPKYDVAAMRVIGRQCPTAMLYCGGPDKWAPQEHIQDIKDLQRRNMLPNNIFVEYFDNLVHDFIVHPEMVPTVVEFCVKTILSRLDSSKRMSLVLSRL